MCWATEALWIRLLSPLSVTALKDSLSSVLVHIYYHQLLKRLKTEKARSWHKGVLINSLFKWVINLHLFGLFVGKHRALSEPRPSIVAWGRQRQPHGVCWKRCIRCRTYQSYKIVPVISRTVEVNGDVFKRQYWKGRWRKEGQVEDNLTFPCL